MFRCPIFRQEVTFKFKGKVANLRNNSNQRNKSSMHTFLYVQHLTDLRNLLWYIQKKRASRTSKKETNKETKKERNEETKKKKERSTEKNQRGKKKKQTKKERNKQLKKETPQRNKQTKNEGNTKK